jgi:hypothetical protein
VIGNRIEFIQNRDSFSQSSPIEPDRADAYNPAAAALAWDRTLDFLQHSVKL